jgi:hypothetical protein
VGGNRTLEAEAVLVILDFPNSPTLNQLYPSPPVTGLPVYQWDGEKWLLSGGGGGAAVYVSDTPPVGVPDNSLWWESDTGVLYVRYNDGDSTQWVVASPVPDQAAFVQKTGDTMTGPLTISTTTSNASLALTNTGSANQNVLFGNKGGLNRWAIVPGNSTVESGSNAGSDFSILRYDDGGTYIAAPITIVRSSGQLNVGPAGLSSQGNVVAGAVGTTGSYYFGNTGTKNLNYDGTNFGLNGGSLTVAGNIGSSPTSTTGAYYFGNSGAKYLGYDGTNFNLNGGNLIVASGIAFSGGPYITYNGSAYTTSTNFIVGGSLAFDGGPYITYNGSAYAMTVNFSANGITATAGIISGYGFSVRQGTTGPTKSNFFNIDYGGGTAVGVYIDATYMGNITWTSDYRIKKDVIDLPGMWETVKKLRPIKYTQAAFSPPSHLAHVAKAKADGQPIAEGPLFAADNIERWGFIAHELQKATITSVATGEKDSPDIIQSPNAWVLIAALTKTLQEAMVRIEALEART